jgi:hypothetical protein
MRNETARQSCDKQKRFLRIGTVDSRAEIQECGKMAKSLFARSASPRISRLGRVPDPIVSARIFRGRDVDRYSFLHSHLRINVRWIETRVNRDPASVWLMTLRYSPRAYYGYVRIATKGPVGA